MNDSNNTDFIRAIVNYFGGMLTGHHRDLVTHLRTPTPQKITYVVQADGTGTIGGGFANPNPISIYQCPMSHEAWIHRISITSPSAQPKTPLTTGQLMCIGGSNEIQFFLPLAGQVAPVQITEGRGSAIHLNSGSAMRVYGDSLPANTSLRIDLQILLVTGVSEYTPKLNAPEYQVID